MSETIDRAIARLEHQTATEMLGPPIAPLGADPDHCQLCACVAAKHYIAASSVISDGRSTHHSGPWCDYCGADWKGLA